jgi:hypothetical protein
MLDEFTYLLADFTSCKFSFGEESILQEKNSKAKERTSNLPCKKNFKLNKKITKFKLKGLSIKYSKKKERKIKNKNNIKIIKL